MMKINICLLCYVCTYYVSAREDVKQQKTSNVMITLGVS